MDPAFCTYKQEGKQSQPELAAFPGAGPGDHGTEPDPPSLAEQRLDKVPQYLWSAKVSEFSRLRVPAVANMMVVSRSAMMPETALAAVMHACVPRFPA